MAGATTVGATQVSLTPDFSRFGSELRTGLPPIAELAGKEAGRVLSDAIGDRLQLTLPKALRDAGRLMEPVALKVGTDVGDQFATGFEVKLAARLAKMKPSVTVKVILDDARAKAAMGRLTDDREAKVTVLLDDTAAKTALGKLTADRTVKVTVNLDDAAAKTKLAALAGSTPSNIDIVVKINEAAYKRAEKALDKLTADRTIIIRPSVDTRVAAEEIRNLTRRQRVRIGVDVDTRVAANDIANLTRRRMLRVTAQADTVAATTALRFLARDRTANVRVRTSGLAGLNGMLSGLGSGGSGGGGIGMLSGRIVALTAAALLALPQIASLGSAIAQMGPATAIVAPALTMLITAFAAVKIGLSGVGDAFKAAFADSSGEAKAAANATRQVAAAQRSLGMAQRGVGDAERALTQAQRAARQAQDELSGARRQASRDLQDMNARLRQGSLDQEQATLDIQQAEVDLQAIRSDPTATQLQIQQADLSVQRAMAAAEEQSRQQKRLAADTAAANKAGVAGSATVVAAKNKITEANQQVVDRERAVAEAHRQVADAARALAQAQGDAASQTSKLAQAMAKLSPNARAFVNEVKAMAPAWHDLKLDVQDALFAGLGRRLSEVSRQIIPTLRTGLAGTATELNGMAKGVLNSVASLQKTGLLAKVFDGVRTSLGKISKIPAQLVEGLAKLSVAAAPAFDRLTKGAGGAMDKLMVKLDEGMKSGKLTEAIDTALNVAVQFGKVLADVFGILKNVMGAAATAGGDFFGTIGAALKEIRRITALPEVQAALKAIFSALNAVAKLLATTLGAALQAVLPVLAALAPSVIQLADILGPVLAQLAETLGAALLPIAKTLGPVLVVAGKAFGALVKALSPLLPVIGELIAKMLPSLTPLLDVLVTVFTALAPVISLVAKVLGATLGPIITSLAKVFAEIAKQFAVQFLLILKQLIPIIPMLIPVVLQLAKSLTEILLALAPLLPQIMLLGVQMVTQLLPALLPLIPPMTKWMTLLTRLATWVITAVVLPALTKLIGFMAAMRKKMQPAVDAVKWLTEKMAAAFDWVYDHLLHGRSVIPDIVNGAIGWFTGLYNKGRKIFTDIKTSITSTWDKLWGNVRSVASGAWRLVREGFNKFADGLTTAFRALKDGIGTVWSGLKALVKAPVKFWIETVYNRGIVGVWNATAAKIPGIGNLAKMAMPKGFARGGVLPGSSSWRQGDDQLVPMRRGEGVYVSEAMQDPYERARLHAVNQAAMRGQSLTSFRGFAEGGILGSLGDIGSGIVSGVGKVLGKGGGAVRGGLANLAEAAFKPVKAGITAALGSNKGTWPGMLGAAPIHLMNSAVNYIRSQDIVGGEWAKPVNASYGTKFGVAGRMWSSGHHTGLDFPAATGTRIGAVADGTVASAASGGPYGKHLTMNHGGGLQSLYAHMSAIAAKAGASIAQGDRIGSVGATGNTTGPHLHLEARLNGRAVDPMRYLEGGNDSGGNGGKGVSRWHGTVVSALRAVNQSVGLANTTLRRMNQESGGNPNAVNKWDSNWTAGHPSVGLMQVIRGTFDAYAGKYQKTGPKLYGVSVDPMANIYASMRYALSRYGSLSAAYNRPGGYAKGGIVGGGIRIGTGHRAAGYAKGGIIKVAGKQIDTGPIKASVGGNFLKSLAGSAAAIDAAMTRVATALKNAFKGVKTTLDDKLLAQVKKQSTILQNLAKQRDQIKSQIAAAGAFAVEAASSGKSFAAMTSLPSAGNTFDAGGILNGLNSRLSQLKKFSGNLEILAKRGLNKELLQQIIAAGPEGGAAYAQALVGATDSQLKAINSAQVAIGKASTNYGKSAADAMFDAGKQSGAGYLAGLKATEKSITDQMSALAKAIQKAIKDALQIKSPSLVMKAIGINTGLGFAGGVRASVPKVVAAAAQMASVVRSTAAAGTASIATTNSSTTNGDRNLNYHATTREVASRQSILAALAMDDMLHRTAMSGA